ncbi:RdgB/HAM1 family non-canonical purine NTP pyrophosphatase [uncultured Clostridium sp.]|uniref:RdgB/HAM1 family non-canonical purine NTP pyrophosphatase n=1 Tax=uncultured Clostridium sp. TaxID=59620 RepID=UPI003216D986
MRRLIVASNNNHKILEIKEILKEFNLDVISLKEAGIDIDVEETGNTFMENAWIKAKAIHEICKDVLVLSDDSGLSVEVLNGAPGIYSARYSGGHGNSVENNKKLIGELQGVPFDERKAKFICAMVLIVDDKNIIKVQGEVDGLILEEYKECEGFGYDPLFYVPELNATFNDVPSKVKNAISHRGNALAKLTEEMKKYL